MPRRLCLRMCKLMSTRTGGYVQTPFFQEEKSQERCVGSVIQTTRGFPSSTTCYMKTLVKLLKASSAKRHSNGKERDQEWRRETLPTLLVYHLIRKKSESPHQCRYESYSDTCCIVCVFCFLSSIITVQFKSLGACWVEEAKDVPFDSTA